MSYQYYKNLLEKEEYEFKNDEINMIYKIEKAKRTSVEYYKNRYGYVSRPLKIDNNKIKPKIIRYLSWNDIRILINKIENINKFKTLIGIYNGGAFISTFISEIYNIPVKYVRTKRKYKNRTSKNDKIEYNKEEIKNIEEPVLIIDDICRTGNTIDKIKKILKRNKKIDVKTFVLFDSPIYKTDYNLNKYFIDSNNFIRIFCSPWGFDT